MRGNVQTDPGAKQNKRGRKKKKAGPIGGCKGNCARFQRNKMKTLNRDVTENVTGDERGGTCVNRMNLIVFFLSEPLQARLFDLPSRQEAAARGLSAVDRRLAARAQPAITRQEGHTR